MTKNKRLWKTKRRIDGSSGDRLSFWCYGNDVGGYLQVEKAGKKQKKPLAIDISWCYNAYDNMIDDK